MRVVPWGQTEERTDRGTDRQRNGQTEERTDRGTDRQRNGQTEERTDMEKPIVAFRNFVEGIKNFRNP